MDVGAGEQVGQGVCTRGVVYRGEAQRDSRDALGRGCPLRAHLAGEEPGWGGAALPRPRCLPWGLTFHFPPLPG